MEIALLVVVAVLAFANGANDNFKGVATLWGAGRTGYAGALAVGTGFTLIGSLLSLWLAAGLATKFSGSALVGERIASNPVFLLSVAAGAGATVLLATRLGLPVSTTHALTGALTGAGVFLAGFGGVAFGSLGSGIVAPLLFSPIAALALTAAFSPFAMRLARKAEVRDCVCLDLPRPAVAATPEGALASVAVTAPTVRIAHRSDCATGNEAVRLIPLTALHWLSGAAISFARGLNDTPKIAALLLVASAFGVNLGLGVTAVAMAVGGLLGAARVARTLSHRITPMGAGDSVTANLVAAGLVLLASRLALPVSTTHVTSGGIFGIGLVRREATDWRRVRDILLSWVATLPLAAVIAGAVCALLTVTTP